jgi:hypothetical protein
MTPFVARDDTEFFGWTFDITPGQPNAVGGPYRCFAHVLGEIIGIDHVLTKWFLIFRIVVVRIKNKDHELTVDFDRIVLLFVVEKDPSTESANAWLVGLP